MAENSEQVRAVLGASGILADALPGEILMIVVPSKRLKSGRFAILLQTNGVSCRALGHGSGRVSDPRGLERYVRGILVLAVTPKDRKRAELYARLFGVSFTWLAVTAIPN